MDQFRSVHTDQMEQEANQRATEAAELPEAVGTQDHGQDEESPQKAEVDEQAQVDEEEREASEVEKKELIEATAVGAAPKSAAALSSTNDSLDFFI